MSYRIDLLSELGLPVEGILVALLLALVAVLIGLQVDRGRS